MVLLLLLLLSHFSRVQPHRWQPTRLPRPWDSPGKNTGMGCHFLLQRMKVKSESEVAQSCPTLSDPMDCSPPGSSVHGIFQARVLEWGAIAFSELWFICCQIFATTMQTPLLQGSRKMCPLCSGLILFPILWSSLLLLFRDGSKYLPPSHPLPIALI